MIDLTRQIENWGFGFHAERYRDGDRRVVEVVFDMCYTISGRSKTISFRLPKPISVEPEILELEWVFHHGRPVL